MTDFRRRSLALVGAFLLVVPFAVGARAQAPIETALKDLVAAIDAAPDWNASYRALAYDAASDTGVVSGLTIATPDDSLRIGFETVSVSGYVPAPDGGFTAKSMSAGGGALDAEGVFKLALSEIKIDDLAIPGFEGVAYSREQPFTSILRIYTRVLKTRFARAELGSLALIEQIEGVTSRISYENFVIAGVADGKIATVTAGPIRMESPSPEGLVTMSVGSVESRDTDLAAFVHVFDPDQYVNGVGDMIWRNTIGFAGYRDVVIELPGAKVTVGEFSVNDFRLRQPRVSFAEFFDVIMARRDMPKEEADELALRHLPGLATAFGFGRFAFGPLTVEAAGVDRMVLGDFHISDLSSDGLGEFAIEGFDGAVQGQGTVKIGRFAFGGIVFPGLDTVLAAMRAEAEQMPFDETRLIPTLGFIDLAGIDAETPDVPPTALGKLRVDLRDYLGPVPTSVAIDIAGLEVPVSVIDDPETREMFARLGYDRLSANYGLKLRWNEADETLNIENIHAGFEDMGSLTVSLELSGLPRAAIENPETIEALIPTLSLVRGKITFKNEAIVGRGLALLAEQMHVPPDKFQQQFADAMPFLLSMAAVNDPTLMALVKQSGLLAKLTPAVKEFIAGPAGSITFTLNPPTPVAFPAIAMAAENAPDKLVALLGIDITGDAGELPSPPQKSGTSNEPAKGNPPPAKEMRPTLDPAN